MNKRGRRRRRRWSALRKDARPKRASISSLMCPDAASAEDCTGVKWQKRDLTDSAGYISTKQPQQQQQQLALASSAASRAPSDEVDGAETCSSSPVQHRQLLQQQDRRGYRYQPRLCANWLRFSVRLLRHVTNGRSAVIAGVYKTVVLGKSRFHLASLMVIVLLLFPSCVILLRASCEVMDRRQDEIGILKNVRISIYRLQSSLLSDVSLVS